MSGAFNLLESSQITYTRFLSRTSQFSRGCYQTQRSTKSKTLCCCRSMQTFTCELVNDKSSAKAETIGAFQKLPMVMPSVDVFHSALRKMKRVLPAKVVDLEMPTLCLVGAPNVGKSSLVRLLSIGKLEVCNYPFTTRGILMGHITIDYQHFQITDTPGLLKRCDESRNNLEKLTLAVLSHLPTAILYVQDLSGECGMSPSDQFMIYKEISERFDDHLWLNIISKCDLLQESPVVFITEDGEADHFCKHSILFE